MGIEARTLEELDELFEKARKKAIEINPELIIQTFGHYKVASKTIGKYYDVYCGRNEFGFFVSCSCRGSLERKPCYHGAKAMIVHKANAQVKIDKRKQKEGENKLYG